MGDLKVYQASAGSGKTYMLALQYILLLFRNPLLYRNILAVTFTNKAAGEMKSRIIEKLFLLQKGDELRYQEEIQKAFDLSESEIQKRAGEVLKSILHNYSCFSVQTIDSFFQKILRVFALELGLQYTYGLQLDQDKVLNAATDALLQEADENKDVRDWLISFAASKIEEGKAWNIKQDILGLGKQLFTEKVKILIPELRSLIMDKDLRGKYLTGLKEIKRSFEAFMRKTGIEATHIFEKHSLSPEFFYYKDKGPAAYFSRIIKGEDFDPKTYVRKVLEDPEKWVSAKSKNRTFLMRIVNEELHPILVRVVDHYDQHYRNYLTASIILKQFYTLGIYVDLEGKIQEYTRENNEFLISDLANFLAGIIDHNEAPFIYEKTGSVFRHFFLDEFQDTSVIQWNNFKPLVTGSLSAGNMNMVVGDVKQSIYRWRNGDWKILGEKIYEDFSQFEPKKIPLDGNYRSKENIVRFNNTFFMEGATLLQEKFNREFDTSGFGEAEISSMSEKIRFVYENAVQEPSRPDNPEGGRINCFFFEGSYTEWKNPVDLKFPEDIKQLIKEGVNPGEIVILVRGHKDGKRAVDALMKFREEDEGDVDMNFPIVSNESLYLSSSPPVRFLLNFLHYLVMPEDKLNLAGMIFEYQTIHFSPVILDTEGKYTDLFCGDIENDFLSEKILNEVSFLKKLSLPEILEGAIRIFKIGGNSEDVPYLLAFADVVSDYIRENPGDIVTFLNWWDEEGDKKSLQANDATDALQVMTIHKAKGLQFGHVFMPYTDWGFDHTGQNVPVLWCRTNGLEEPFSQYPVIPVKYSKDLVNSFFNRDYYIERLDSFIDAMNMLYVAFTRAEDSLWIYGPKAKTDVKTVSGLLDQVLNLDVASQTSGKAYVINNPLDYWNEKSVRWNYGEPGKILAKKEKLAERLVLDRFPGWPGFERMRLKYQGEDYFSEERLQKIKRGTILHELFEFIRTPADVKQALITLNEQGKINADEMIELEKHVKKLISDPEVIPWFSGDWEVKREAGIILNSGKVRRPDRVMIKGNNAIVVDYKFGAVKNDKYRIQVRTYLHDLKQMGYENIQGYLWYVELEEVEEV
jgi:ATP-dependent exoDNAse (exonuclease V) beta subunit